MSDDGQHTRHTSDAVDRVDAPLRTAVRSFDTLHALATRQRLYGVIDTAGDPGTYEYLLTLGARARCLYFGTEGARFAAIAPWLVQLDPALCDWIQDALAVRSPDWGVFVVSSASPAAVARQLRRWLTVRDPDGVLVRFRFYDPRVLFDFLGACSADELDAFFGPSVEAFATYAERTCELRLYARASAPVALPRARIVIQLPDASAPPTAGLARPFPLGLPRRTAS